MTTNGTAPQTTSSMMTARPWVPLANQLWPIMSTPGTWLSSQFSTPKSLSNIHLKMVMATTIGMPQLATRAMLTRVFTQPETRWSSRAISMPSTMVSTTAVKANRTVRTTTVQNSLSLRTLVKLSKPTDSGSLNPQSCGCPNFWKDRVTRRTSG